ERARRRRELPGGQDPARRLRRPRSADRQERRRGRRLARRPPRTAGRGTGALHPGALRAGRPPARGTDRRVPGGAVGPARGGLLRGSGPRPRARPGLPAAQPAAGPRHRRRPRCGGHARRRAARDDRRPGAAPGPGLAHAPQQRIQQLARDIADDLDVVGMLAVELFETADGRVLVNELAMRPHNTGHWSMDGAVTGQFEQHVRAVADLPLGAVDPVAPAAVMVNLLGSTAEDLVPGMEAALAADPELKVHLYGKAVRPGRKIGHVTLIGQDTDELLQRAHRAEQLIIHGPGAGTDETTTTAATSTEESL